MCIRDRFSDAVKVLADRRISELPVIDSQGRPVGLIDITDVVALLPSDSATDASPLNPSRDGDVVDAHGPVTLPFPQALSENECDR